MKKVIVAIASCALATGAALAFNNEAVKVLPDGTKNVELPPGPKHKGFRNIKRTTDPWPAGGRLPSFVIETDKGLIECTVRWIDDSCREYTPGRDKRPRAWVVKHKGAWVNCPRRNSEAGCTPYHSLPTHELQD